MRAWLRARRLRREQIKAWDRYWSSLELRQKVGRALDVHFNPPTRPPFDDPRVVEQEQRAWWL